jgi:hypothetical protein
MRKLHQEEFQAPGDHGGSHYASQASLKGCFGERKPYVINQRAGIKGHMTRSDDGSVVGRGWAARPALGASVSQSKYKSTLVPMDIRGSAASLPARQMQEQAMHKTVNHDDHPYANSTTTVLPLAVGTGGN